MGYAKEIEHYTVEDYRLWRGDWELIDGIAYAMAPSPGVTHQSVASQVVLQLGPALKDCPHCRVLFEIDVEFNRDTVVRPDVLVLCHAPEGERITRAPALIFEIVSPTRPRRDEVVKFQLYAEEGVAQYAIVYPEERRVKLWRLIDGGYRKVADFNRESHRFELEGCAFEFDFSKLWVYLDAPAG